MNKKDNFHAVFKKYFKKEERFLIPNVLCYVRILLIPLFVTIYLLPTFVPSNNEANVYIATGIMLISAYTDFLDGFIARKFDMKSNLGKILDPMADKIMQLGVSIALVVKFKNFASVFTLLSIFVIKEIWMMIMSIILARANRAFGSAKWYGKVSSFSFYVIVGTIFIGGPLLQSNKFGLSYTIQHYIIDSLSLVASSFLLFAALQYTILFNRLLKHGQDEVIINKTEEEKHD